MKDVLSEFVSLVVEKKMREVDHSDGGKVPHGSSKHVRDLKGRIKSLEMWRNKQKRGSEARANYSRLISRLKSELASAIRTKKVVKESLTPEEAMEYIELERQRDNTLRTPAAISYVDRAAEQKQDTERHERMNFLIKKSGARNLSDMDRIVRSLLG